MSKYLCRAENMVGKSTLLQVEFDFHSQNTSAVATTLQQAFSLQFNMKRKVLLLLTPQEPPLIATALTSLCKHSSIKITTLYFLSNFATLGLGCLPNTQAILLNVLVNRVEWGYGLVFLTRYLSFLTR